MSILYISVSFSEFVWHEQEPVRLDLADVLPSYEFDLDDPSKVIPITLLNRSDVELRYAVFGDGFRHIDFNLEQAGRRVPKAVHIERRPVQADEVRVVPPHEAATHDLNLSHWYAPGDIGDPLSLKQGTYVLTVGFSSHESGAGLTAISVPLRPVAIVRIRDPA
jgi:hypothetical protein